MTEIAKFLQFNITFKLVDDGKYGSTDEHGNWNGMNSFYIIKISIIDIQCLKKQKKQDPLYEAK